MMREYYEEVAVDEDNEWELMKAHALIELLPVASSIEEAVINYVEG